MLLKLLGQKYWSSPELSLAKILNLEIQKDCLLYSPFPVLTLPPSPSLHVDNSSVDIGY